MSGFYDRHVAKIYTEYERLLAASNAVRFSTTCWPGWRSSCAISLRYAFCSANDTAYVLIDEYQDTNRAQYIIAHGIAMDHENICATGEPPTRSIYAWRGADINNILDFEKDYPNACVIRLEENYRSTPAILAAASSLISHNRQRKDKTLWTRRPAGEKVRVVSLDDEHAEAAYVAGRIAQLRTAGTVFSDIAVFYRVNSLSRVMEEHLIRAGISYRIARGVEFYNRKEVRDVLAYLKILVNPADSLSTERIINTPPRGIGATTIKRLQEFAVSHGLSLLGAAAQADRIESFGAPTAKKVLAFAQLIDKLSQAATNSVKAIVEKTIEASGLAAALAASDEEDRQALSNIEELVSTAAEFDSSAGPDDPRPTLADFLHQVSPHQRHRSLRGAPPAPSP